jgi:hypothetical protein
MRSAASSALGLGLIRLSLAAIMTVPVPNTTEPILADAFYNPLLHRSWGKLPLTLTLKAMHCF